MPSSGSLSPSSSLSLSPLMSSAPRRDMYRPHSRLSDAPARPEVAASLGSCRWTDRAPPGRRGWDARCSPASWNIPFTATRDNTRRSPRALIGPRGGCMFPVARRLVMTLQHHTGRDWGNFSASTSTKPCCFLFSYLNKQKTLIFLSLHNYNNIIIIVIKRKLC